MSRTTNEQRLSIASLLLAAGIGVSSWAVAALAVPTPAYADDSAAEHAKRARVAYDLQNWPLAIQEYQSAYGADQKPDYLFGLAQAQRQAGDYPAAIASFKAYKRLDAVSPQQATAAELLITKCEADQAKKDAEAAPKKPEPATAPSSPTAPPSAAPSKPATPEPGAGSPKLAERGDKHFYEDPLGDTLFVLGVGGLVGGSVVLAMGNSDMKGSKSLPTEAAAATAADKAQIKQIAGAVTLGAGGALLGGAILRWALFDGKRAPAAAGLLIGPTGLGYQGEF